jgi:hypothetical protein
MEGLDDEDVKGIIDYQIILDIEDMIRIEVENGK